MLLDLRQIQPTAETRLAVELRYGPARPTREWIGLFPDTVVRQVAQESGWNERSEPPAAWLATLAACQPRVLKELVDLTASRAEIVGHP